MRPSEKAYFITSYKTLKGVLSWLEAVDGDPLRESSFWNIKRETYSNNCDESVLKEFLKDLDNELLNYTESEMKKKLPYEIFNNVNNKKYCLIGKDLRGITLDDLGCNGLDPCMNRKSIDTMQYSNNVLCRTIQTESFLRQFKIPGCTPNELYSKIRDRSIYFESKIEQNYKYEGCFWVSEYKYFEKLAEKNKVSIADEVRNHFGLNHFTGQEMILVKYPVDNFFIRKIAKPTVNLGPSVPFKVNISDKHWGKAVHLVTAKDAAPEAVICPHNFSPLLDFELTGLGRPQNMKSFNTSLHNERSKI